MHMIDNRDNFGILYVDDEEKALKYFSRAFVDEFPVFTVSSVSEAKLILEKHASEIGVLITDQRMPEAKGVELLKFVRKEYPQIVRILTTAYSDLDDAIEAVNSGEILRYITKPWNIKALKSELRQSMQFFELKSERDALVREKLSTWERLEGVNRLRDLLMIASGFTLTKNSIPAVQAFVEQVPARHLGAKGESQFNTWDKIQADIKRMLKVSSDLAATIGPANSMEPHSSIEIIPLLGKMIGLSGFEGRAIVDADESTLAIESHIGFVELLCSSLFKWVNGLRSDGNIKFKVSAREEAITIDVLVDSVGWGDCSIVNIPGDLLSAYFIVYHLSGTIKVVDGSDDSLSISLELPRKQRKESTFVLDDSWLESVLVKFENW